MWLRFWFILCVLLRCLFSYPVLAADIVVTSPFDGLKFLSQDNQKLIISDNGNITGGSAKIGVVVGAKNLVIEVDAAANKGIVVTGAAIATFSSLYDGCTINLNSGVITSSNDTVSHNAISLSERSSATNATAINVASGATISTTSSNSAATVLSYAGYNLQVNNAGTISSSYTAFQIKDSGSGKPASGALGNSINNSGLIVGKIEISGATLGLISLPTTISNSGTINGNIEFSNSSRYALLEITNSGTMVGNVDLGSVLGSHLTMNGGSLTGNVTLGANATKIYDFSLGTGLQSFNLNGGTFVGDTTLNSLSSLNLGSGILNGAVNGASSGVGVVNVNEDFTLQSSSSIGATNRISTLNVSSDKKFTANGSVAVNNLNIASGAEFILGSNVTATNTNLYGTLDFGDSTKTFTGNISGEGSGKINVGGVTQTVNGNVTLNSGDTFNLGFYDAANVGKLVVNGAATVGSGTKMAIDLSSNYGYIANGSKFTVIDGGAGSVINAVSSANVNVNGSGSNKSGILTFTTSVSGDDLVLDVSRKAASEVSRNKSSQNIYNVINDIGSTATGDLKTLQQYLDTSSVSQASDALEQLVPQDSNSIRMTSIAVINNSLSTIESRLESVRNISVINPELAESQDYGGARLYQVSYKPVCDDNSFNKKIVRFKGRPKKGDKNYNDKDKVVISKNNGIWGQVFGANAKQKDLGNNDGYESQATGIAFGYDRKFDKNTILGLGFSYANSQSKSSDATKHTNISTYQLSAYSEQNFGKYFWDNILGFALNDYNSNRVISAINKTADGDYLGQIYIAKVRGGFAKNLGHNFIFIPELSSTFNHIEIDSYTESGAGDLSLHVNKSSSNFLEGRGGVSFGYKNTTKSGLTLLPKISVSYGYNFLNKRQSVVSNFAGQSATFNSTSSKLDPRSFKFGGSLDLFRNNSSTLTTEYVQERRNTYRSDYLLLRTRITF